MKVTRLIHRFITPPLSHSNDPFIHRWQHVVALAALSVSAISAWVLHSEIIDNRQQNRAPNVRLRWDDAYQNTDFQDDHKLASVRGTVILENYGGAPTNIVDVHGEALTMGSVDDINDMWVAFSDGRAPWDDPEYFKTLRNNPVLGVSDTSIPPHSTRRFTVALFGESDTQSESYVVNVRIKLTFDDGKELTLIPEVSAITGSF